jgi:hypothetical protein
MRSFASILSDSMHPVIREHTEHTEQCASVRSISNVCITYNSKSIAPAGCSAQQQ